MGVKPVLMAQLRRRPWVASAGRHLRWLANPVITAVLRSPFHKMLSGSLALLTVTGRRTGKRYVFPVRYAESGPFFFVLAGGHEQKAWWRNLLEPAQVRFRVAGCEFPATGEALVGAERPEAAAALRSYFARFPASAALRGLQADKYGHVNSHDVAFASEREVVVRVVPAGAIVVPEKDAWMTIDVPDFRF